MDALSKSKKLGVLKSYSAGCQNCALSKTRTHLVFGDGNPEASVVFIGEAPGKDEDLQGKPFVGRSGQLLSQMIDQVFGWNRDHYYITNILKCRPTVDQKMIKDRPPEKEEIEHCMPLLMEQLKILEPSVLITVGASSTRALLNTNLGITALRGKWSQFMDIPLLPVFHPSYLLRNGGQSSRQYKIMISDLELVRKFLQERKQSLS